MNVVYRREILAINFVLGYYFDGEIILIGI